MLETIKQMIAIKKLMKRNYQRTLKHLTSSEVVKSGNNTPTVTPNSEKVTSAEEHSQAIFSAADKIHLPIIFVLVENAHKAKFDA